MNAKLLYNTIYNYIFQENEELFKLTDFGIFNAPELYIAFNIGKEIKKSEIQLFGNKTDWIRETNFGGGGPSDFIFQSLEKTYIFELKLRDTIHSYTADIEKLLRLDKKYEKYFMALVDAYERDNVNDGRIVELENRYDCIVRVSEFKSFYTKQERYKSDIHCVVGVWKIKN